MKRLLPGTVLLALTMSVSGLSGATEYLVVASKPNLLNLVDVEARAVEKSFEMPDAGPGAMTISVDEANRIAYVLLNSWGSVAGIDLETGEQVFRADLSQDGRRVRAIQGLEVSPDGRHVYVNCLPVRMGLGEYEVEDTYIAVYDTSDGTDAKPVRKIPVPRRVAVLVGSEDGTELYALGHELHVFDPATGEHLRDHRIRTSDTADRTPADILDFWNQWEQAGVFSTPYFTVDTSRAEDDPAAYRMGMLTMDLETKEFDMEEYENFEVIIFSTVVNPVRRNEAYGVYTQLSKIDLEKDELIARKDMDHTYYAVNVSADGSELYAGGTLNDIAVYDTETLEKIGSIDIPGGNMALSSMRMLDM